MEKPWSDKGDGTYWRYYRKLTWSQLDALIEDAIHYQWKNLDLVDTGITALPDTIGQLSSLQKLDLSGTKITTLPDTIGQLSNLQMLNLRGTRITTLPDTIGQLSSLQLLDLSRTRITTLPDTIGQLSSLQALFLVEINIEILPDSIGQLSSLQTLYLNETKITVLPDSIGQLSSLQTLYLNETEITVLPDTIGQLSSLQLLDLRETRITTLPDTIGQLSSLQALFLVKSNIVILPDTIGQLSSLQTLNLNSTGIRTLPDTIGQLSNLQTLYLNGTEITALPDTIGQLSSLQELHLRESRIASLPDTTGQLSNLKTLDLRRIRITTLPDTMGQLSNLKTLRLSGCHLKSIPYSLVQLSLYWNLRFVTDNSFATNCINLTGVTLDEGVLSLFDQPLELIEEYYRDEAAEEETVQECKVIFLGDGKVGKSSLIERIIFDRFEEGTLPTDGVKMTKWQVWPNGKPLTLNDKPLTVRFLDFGGQEIMHSMHRCFLTNHTVYVVVCESRDDAEIDRVAARWMETVRSFAPECPVILVLNKCDLNPHVTINERDLKAFNPAYRHTLHASAKENTGILELIRSILREIPDCLRKMGGNRRFLGLKQKLESMEADYLSPDQLRKECDHFRIREELRENVLNWFQDLGVAYPYSAGFQQMYVLNPEWLTNGIYRLILRTPNGGFMRHSEILRTLRTPHPNDVNPEKIYTEQEMQFILHIMRQFEISLRITPEYEADQMEMIPMKMDKTPPERYDDFVKDDALHLRWEAGYLPNNLIHRIMIRKYPELDPERKPGDKCVWRTGGWFRDTVSGCEALAEMTEKALDVYVRGRENEDQRDYLATFRREIPRILGKLGITAKEFVYCTVNGKEGRIEYNYIMKRLKKGKREIWLGDIDEDVPIDWILRNYIYPSENGRRFTGSPAMETRDFFISYNNERDGDRAREIANTLQGNGHTVWLYEDDCKNGMSFPAWMAEAIEHSNGLIAVWSEAYESSPYCKDELNAAYVKKSHNASYRLLVMRVSDVPIHNALFRQFVYTDLLSPDPAENRAAILKAVEG